MESVLLKVHAKLEVLGGMRSTCMALALILSATVNAYGILRYPHKEQVAHALQRGIDFAQQHRPPNELYSHFGSKSKFEPHGFLVTKVSGLAVMSGHYALRGEQPTEQDIQRLLGEDALQVVVTIFGNTPGFARDSYLLFKQDDQMIKPERIRLDARARSVGHDQRTSIFRAKIVGVFPYGTFDPDSHATLLVFPGAGREIKFDLDLSTIP